MLIESTKNNKRTIFKVEKGMKDTANIKVLIALYFEGKTNAAQEEILKAFFSQEQLPDAFKEDQVLMQALFQKDTIQVPADLEGKINASLDTLIAKEKQQVTFSFKKWTWMAAAAVLFLIVSLPFYLTHTTEQIAQPTQLSQTDREKIEEAQRALLLLSKNYNKGLQQLALSQEVLTESHQVLNKVTTITKP